MSQAPLPHAAPGYAAITLVLPRDKFINPIDGRQMQIAASGAVTPSREADLSPQQPSRSSLPSAPQFTSAAQRSEPGVPSSTRGQGIRSEESVMETNNKNTKTQGESSPLVATDDFREAQGNAGFVATAKQASEVCRSTHPQYNNLQNNLALQASTGLLSYQEGCGERGQQGAVSTRSPLRYSGLSHGIGGSEGKRTPEAAVRVSASLQSRGVVPDAKGSAVTFGRNAPQGSTDDAGDDATLSPPIIPLSLVQSSPPSVFRLPPCPRGKAVWGQPTIPAYYVSDQLYTTPPPVNIIEQKLWEIARNGSVVEDGGRAFLTFLNKLLPQLANLSNLAIPAVFEGVDPTRERDGANSLPAYQYLSPAPTPFWSPQQQLHGVPRMAMTVHAHPSVYNGGTMPAPSPPPFNGLGHPLNLQDVQAAAQHLARGAPLPVSTTSSSSSFAVASFSADALTIYNNRSGAVPHANAAHCPPYPTSYPSPAFPLVHAGVIDYIIMHHVSIGRWSLDTLRQIIRWPRWCFNYCGPMVSAVKSRCAGAVRLLCEESHRIDPNTGCPLRLAVLQGDLDIIDDLLRCERVNPNRGSPLYHAISRNNVAAVRMLLDHPRTMLNKITAGHSMTPLIASIRYDSWDCFQVLVSHHRVDVNRGFCWTPLQVAVMCGRSEYVRAMLARPLIEPNATIHRAPTRLPIVVACENNDGNVLKALLEDPRVSIPPSFIDKLEEENNLNILQILSSYGPHEMNRMGFIWSVRYVLNCIIVFLLVVLGLVEMVRAVMGYRGLSESEESLATEPSHASRRQGLRSIFFTADDDGDTHGADSMGTSPLAFGVLIFFHSLSVLGVTSVLVANKAPHLSPDSQEENGAVEMERDGTRGHLDLNLSSVKANSSVPNADRLGRDGTDLASIVTRSRGGPTGTEETPYGQRDKLYGVNVRYQPAASVAEGSIISRQEVQSLRQQQQQQYQYQRGSVAASSARPLPVEHDGAYSHHEDVGSDIEMAPLRVKSPVAKAAAAAAVGTTGETTQAAPDAPQHEADTETEREVPSRTATAREVTMNSSNRGETLQETSDDDDDYDERDYNGCPNTRRIIRKIRKASTTSNRAHASVNMRNVSSPSTLVTISSLQPQQRSTGPNLNSINQQRDTANAPPFSSIVSTSHSYKASGSLFPPLNPLIGTSTVNGAGGSLLSQTHSYSTNNLVLMGSSLPAPISLMAVAETNASPPPAVMLPRTQGSREGELDSLAKAPMAHDGEGNADEGLSAAVENTSASSVPPNKQSLPQDRASVMLQSRSHSGVIGASGHSTVALLPPSSPLVKGGVPTTKNADDATHTIININNQYNITENPPNQTASISEACLSPGTMTNSSGGGVMGAAERGLAPSHVLNRHGPAALPSSTSGANNAGTNITTPATARSGVSVYSAVAGRARGAGGSGVPPNGPPAANATLFSTSATSIFFRNGGPFQKFSYWPKVAVDIRGRESTIRGLLTANILLKVLAGIVLFIPFAELWCLVILVHLATRISPNIFSREVHHRMLSKMILARVVLCYTPLMLLQGVALLQLSGESLLIGGGGGASEGSERSDSRKYRSQVKSSSSSSSSSSSTFVVSATSDEGVSMADINVASFILMVLLSIVVWSTHRFRVSNSDVNRSNNGRPLEGRRGGVLGVISAPFGSD